MSEIKHTPGPWTVMPEEIDKPYVRIRGTRLGERYKIANVLTPEYPGARDQEADETRANSRLIAAAPELLEAAAKLFDLANHFNVSGVYFTEFTENRDALQALEDAIAKAIGSKS